MFSLLVILIKYQKSTSISTTMMQVDLLSKGGLVVKNKYFDYGIYKRNHLIMIPLLFI